MRRKKFLEDNLSALQEDPGSLVVNTTSTFPYSGLDTNSAQLGPNCGAARTVPVGSPKIDPTSRFAPYITCELHSHEHVCYTLSVAFFELQVMQRLEPFRSVCFAIEVAYEAFSKENF